MRQESDSPVDRSVALGRFASEFSRTLEDLKPDICLLYGDRGEGDDGRGCFCVSMRVPIAHLQGGDRSGSIDEYFSRHAITKVIKHSLPSNEDSYQQLTRLGEEEWRIELVGDNHIDCVVAGDYLGRVAVEEVGVE